MAHIHRLLHDNNHQLVLQYDTAKADISALRNTLHDDVLPQLTVELTLPDRDIAWLSEWFSDIGKLSPIRVLLTISPTACSIDFPALAGERSTRNTFTPLRDPHPNCL